MIKDGKEVELTREETLRLHRMMWTDMQKELGDNADWEKRCNFKHEWLESHGYEDVLNDCLLCEYAKDDNDKYCPICNKCPIDWSSPAVHDNYPNPNRGTCSARYMEYHGFGICASAIYLCAPISEILALPEREVK